MLIRHNVRTGRNQSVHFAHDTDKPDVNGAFVSGRTDKVLTNEDKITVAHSAADTVRWWQ